MPKTRRQTSPNKTGRRPDVNDLRNELMSLNDRRKLHGLLLAVRDLLNDHDHVDEPDLAWNLGALSDAVKTVLDDLDPGSGVAILDVSKP